MWVALMVQGLVGAGCAVGDWPATSPVAGRTVGSDRMEIEPSLLARQWHLRHLPSADGLRDPDKWVVAVLDTGVAYETATVRGVSYCAAPSLSHSQFVAPADFVQDDGHPNDDHQHGTHIASLIASDGDVRGVAPGVTLMPVKVLDETNAGTEEALVKGIRHAVRHGAHVLNMSLTLGGDPPSQALLDALAHAHRAGVVMVSASGNEGADAVTWPAASPYVVAVGASILKPDGHLEVASYSNRSDDLDVFAPGGDLRADYDEDGMVDGLLAESISRGEPWRVGYWLMAGTSQAAALASGLAVHLLDAGHSPEEVREALREARVAGLLSYRAATSSAASTTARR